MAKARKANDTATNLGFEVKLWAGADALQYNMNAAAYKHAVLGWMLFKYISDAFKKQYALLAMERILGADPENPDKCQTLSGIALLFVSRSFSVLEA